VNVLNKYEVDFAVSASGDPIATVVFPSNSVKAPASGYSRVLKIFPVPESFLRTNVSNPFNHTFNAFVFTKFPLDINMSLPYHYTVLSPVLDIQIDDAQKEENLTSFGLLRFNVDYASSGIDMKNELCLGTIVNTSNTTYEWQCVHRVFNNPAPGVLTYNFTTIGRRYAVIYKPDPEVYANIMCNTWVCTYPQVLFGIVLFATSVASFFFTWLWRTLIKTKGNTQKAEIRA
jgi:hypothetical protein